MENMSEQKKIFPEPEIKCRGGAEKYGISKESTGGFVVSSRPEDKYFLVADGDKRDDRESVKRHIENGDYFGTLATVLDLTGEIMSIVDQNVTEMRKGIEEINSVNKRNREKMESLKKELVFLQENYKIIKK